MLKRVTTEEDLAYYNFIWMTAWREKGYDFEFSPSVLERWLVPPNSSRSCRESAPSKRSRT